jgi:hypothetical protein
VIVRHSILVLTVLGMIVAVLAWPRLPQPSAYHVMVDQRTFLGIPNCLNVLSNVPFALVGLLGLSATFSHGAGRAPQFLDPWERWPYTGASSRTQAICARIFSCSSVPCFSSC